MWQPIETAPKDQFLLLCGPSGYTTTPMVVTTGRMCSDYHAGRWIDHANNDLTDWCFKPTHWAPLILPGAQPAPSLASGDASLISAGKMQPAQSVKDVIIDDLQSQFDTEGITEHDSGDALIRLSDAIAAVEDNFAQPAPSIPEGWKLFPIEPTPGMMRGAHRLVAAARRVLASADSQGLIRLDESGDVASELRSALEAAPEAKL